MALSQPQLALFLNLFVLLGLCLVADSNFTCPCGENIDISLADLVPCYHSDGQSSAAVLTTPRSCDSFIYVATIQAMIYMTSRRDLNLPLIYLGPDTSSWCYTLFPDIPTYENHLQEALPEVIGEIYDEINANITIGAIIGPQDQELSELTSYITGNKLKKLTVSYSTPNFKLSNHTLFPNFYSTSTSDLFLNKARLQLLYDFSWRKVAVVATDALYDRAQNFYTLASKNLSMELSFPGTFRDDPTNILSDYKENNYRIFVAFIPFDISRYVICKAMRMGLTTSQHVWILPGIYDYMWWHDCTCDNNDEFCSCNDCTEEEMKSAIQGMLFIDASNLLITNSNESEAQISSFHWIFNVSRDLFFSSDTNITEDDRQYLLHSRAPNAYDAVALWAQIWHAAVEDLLNKSNDASATCDAISSNDPRDSEMLTEKMLDILEHNIYCGVSGHYTYSKNNEYEEFGQALVTQFQSGSECTAGQYTNYNVSCERLTLIPIDDSQRPDVNFQLEFVNFSFFKIDSNRLIVPCPYRWKSRVNGSYCLDCYTAPTDGVCRDDSCICYNELNAWTMSFALSLMIIGILTAIFLLILNFSFRNNMHFKSSTPIFNIVIIAGSILMYLSVLFLVFSFTGSRIAKTEEQREILLPVSCEFTTWLLNLGMVLILATLLARNWRLYRIFHNSKIVNRNNLSNAHLALIIILLISPMVLLLIISTAVSPSEYITRNETDNCPHLNVDDSITTKQITYLCTSSMEWKEILIVYNLLLSCGLIFFSYQNAKIRTHFSQEGEFAARAVFVVFLFVIPGFLIDMILLLVSSLPSFWIGFIFSFLAPTIILGGLFIPKFIFIDKDKKEETRIARQTTLTMNYEDKMKEITHLKAVLLQKEANITTFTSMRTPSPRLKDSPATMDTDLPASKHVTFDDAS